MLCFVHGPVTSNEDHSNSNLYLGCLAQKQNLEQLISLTQTQANVTFLGSLFDDFNKSHMMDYYP